MEWRYEASCVVDRSGRFPASVCCGRAAQGRAAPSYRPAACRAATGRSDECVGCLQPVSRLCRSSTCCHTRRVAPQGLGDFRKLREMAQLNRVTAAMENYTLPADVLAFFEKELFNRQHWDVIHSGLTDRNRAVQMAAKAAIARLESQ